MFRMNSVSRPEMFAFRSPRASWAPGVSDKCMPSLINSLYKSPANTRSSSLNDMVILLSQELLESVKGRHNVFLCMISSKRLYKSVSQLSSCMNSDMSSNAPCAASRNTSSSCKFRTNSAESNTLHNSLEI